MRRSTLPFIALLFVLLLAAMAGHAAAQTATPSNPNNVSWSALDPGNDWSAQAIQSVFPVNGSAANSTGNESTVIGTIVGQLTGFISAIAMAFVCYTSLVNIHRVAETANLLSRGMSSLFLVRVGFAAIMMFPLSSGFSTGQAAVVQTAMWGIGMAKSVYTNAVQAIGPDSMLLANPMIPGTQTVVLNLMQDELCRALVNQASGNPNLVPEPTPIKSAPNPGGMPGGFITWSYSLAAGNETGSPVCGTVTIQQPNQNATNIAGVSLDMTSQQQTILTNVLQNDIQPAVQTVAANFWLNKQASALLPLQGVLQTATNDYTQQLTNVATTTMASLRAGLQADQARAGNVGLIQNENQLSALGWTSAGAYYLEFARLNGSTLSLVSATPNVNPPSFEGLGPSLSADLAPMLQSETAYLTKLATYVQTNDGIDAPGGNADLFSGATPGEDGASALEQLLRRIHLTERITYLFANAISPANQWQDPFAGLMQLGHEMILTSMTALGAAGLLSSTTGTAAVTAFNLLTLDFPAAGAGVIAHLMMQFLATPIFLACMAILIPGLVIAFVLPMIPWVMWMGGVAGYLILVCEAVVAVPLWMLAHMTFEGDGLHGRAGEGYSLIFNVLFRPTLMLLGLILGYFVFDAMSWLIRESFGIAAGFVLQNGWLVTNLLGMFVLLSIYVTFHIVIALKSFQMIALIPHHLPKLIGFAAASRVDVDQFSKDAALVGVGGALETVRTGIQGNALGRASGTQAISRAPSAGALASPRRILPPVGSAENRRAGGGMDSTLSASTDVPGATPEV
jgi:conjugal transfer/type IV secretion protein DotA/TraY